MSNTSGTTSTIYTDEEIRATNIYNFPQNSTANSVADDRNPFTRPSQAFGALNTVLARGWINHLFNDNHRVTFLVRIQEAGIKLLNTARLLVTIKEATTNQILDLKNQQKETEEKYHELNNKYLLLEHQAKELGETVEELRQTRGIPREEFPLAQVVQRITAQFQEKDETIRELREEDSEELRSLRLAADEALGERGEDDWHNGETLKRGISLLSEERNEWRKSAIKVLQIENPTTTTLINRFEELSKKEEKLQETTKTKNIFYASHQKLQKLEKEIFEIFQTTDLTNGWETHLSQDEQRELSHQDQLLNQRCPKPEEHEEVKDWRHVAQVSANTASERYDRPVPTPEQLREIVSNLKGQEKHADQLLIHNQAIIFEWENVGLRVVPNKQEIPPTVEEATQRIVEIFTLWDKDRDELVQLRETLRALNTTATIP